MHKKPTILITGGTSGIGRAAAIALIKQGATVAITARSPESGEAAVADIARASGKAARYFVADFASLSSVRSLASAVAEELPDLSVLVNNAGVMEHERKLSADGHELDLAVNYLAPFLLTNLLVPTLMKNAPARIVNVASELHRQGRIDVDDLESEKQFDRYAAYAQSKLALVLFTKKLARDLFGKGVTVNALHPGVVDTKMNTQNIAHMNPLVRFAYSRTFLSPERGAEPIAYLATASEVREVTGAYFNQLQRVEPAPLANDAALADTLWGIAKRMVSL